jgi:HEAT repeat protein
VPSLCRALEDVRLGAVVRRRAAEALGQIGDRCAVRPLCRVLNRRRQIWTAESPSAWDRADNALFETQDQEEVLLRMQVVTALGATGDLRAVRPLCRALEDEHPGVVEQAITALGAIGDPRAVEPLCGLVLDGNRALRETATALAAGGDTRVVAPWCRL